MHLFHRATKNRIDQRRIIYGVIHLHSVMIHFGAAFGTNHLWLLHVTFLLSIGRAVIGNLTHEHWKFGVSCSRLFMALLYRCADSLRTKRSKNPTGGYESYGSATAMRGKSPTCRKGLSK